MFFSRANGDDSLNYEFRHPAELDLLVPHGEDFVISFSRCPEGNLIQIGELPAIYVNGKEKEAAMAIFQTEPPTKKAYGYAVALLVHNTRVAMAEHDGKGNTQSPPPVFGPEGGDIAHNNLNIVNAANAFKCAGHACEPFLTSIYPDRTVWETLEYDYTYTELYKGFYNAASTLFMSMHGINTPATSPDAHYRSAVVFLDETYMDIAERAFHAAATNSAYRQNKVYHLVGVRQRITLQYESEDVA